MSKGKASRCETVDPVDILIRQLAQIERSIQTLLAGQIDAVVDPTNELSILLHQTQTTLYRTNEVLEQWVQQRTAELEDTNQTLRQEIAERQRLQESLQQYIKRLRVLQQLDRMILAACSTEEMAEIVLDCVRRLFPYQQARLVTFNFETNQALVLAVSTDEETGLGKGTCMAPEDVWPIEELRQGKICFISDSQAFPPPLPLIKLLQQEGIRAALHVPLMIRGELIGVLNLGLDSPLPLDFESIDALREIADHIAIGLHQAHLSEQVRRHTVGLERLVHERTLAWRESEARFQRLAEHMPDVIYRYRLKPTPGFEYVSPAATTITGYTLDEYYTDPELLLKLIHPDDLPVLANLQRVGPLSDQPMVLCWIHKDGHIICTEQRNVAAYDDKGTLVAVEGIARDITERKRMEEEKEQLFQEVNRQREQLRALTRQLAEAQETERKELSRELHDRVGSKLTALGLNLNFLQGKLAGLTRGDGAIQARLDDSLALVMEITNHVRDVTAYLRPPVLDDFGLVAALRWYSHQLACRVNFTITVQGEEPVPRLAAPVENALFRIAQEALTNAAKYAQASRVVVTVREEEKIVHLVIFDDGIGFEPIRQAEGTERQGWGLITMVERAEAIGGHCYINSRPGHGTQIIVEVTR